MVNTPNFKRGTGRIAVAYDFEELNGTNPSDQPNTWRHKADQIDVNNPSLVYGTPSNVEEALENLNGLAEILTTVGEGFVTVDGYDTWHIANGTINFDPSIGTLNSYLNPIFDAIVAGTGIPTGFERVKYGGIIVLKAGTYIVDATIRVPPGIVLMGEGFGTKVCNVSSLIIPAYGVEPTPKVVATPAPIFRILADDNRSDHDTAVDPNKFMFSKATKIMNMVICDNFVDPPVLGATYYKSPQNSSGNNPLIMQTGGSNLELENVYLLGRVNFSAGTVVSAATRYAVQLDTPVTTGSYCKITNCFIDGFSQPIEYHTTGGINDSLEITNNKIRSHGYFNGNAVSSQFNCFVSMNDNNLVFSNNVLYGNHSNLKTLVYLNSQLGSAPALQSRSKAIISNNDWIINKSGVSSIIASPFIYDNSLVSTYATRIIVLYFLNIVSGSIANNVFKQTNTITNNYIVDSSGFDEVITVGSLGSTINITLPNTILNEGRKLTIKDQGSATNFNITLVRYSVSEQIEGLALDYVLDVNYQSISLIAINGNWWFVN